MKPSGVICPILTFDNSDYDYDNCYSNEMLIPNWFAYNDSVVVHDY